MSAHTLTLSRPGCNHKTFITILGSFLSPPARETSLSIELLTVEEVGRHQELQGDLRLYWKLWYLCGAVGVAHLVREIHTNLPR